MSYKPTELGQGNWKPIEHNSKEALQDKNGFTNPNLHRRKLKNAENRNYIISIHGVDSYRLTEYVTHDEESRTSEIP